MLTPLRGYIDLSSVQGPPVEDLEGTEAFHLEAWQRAAIESITSNDWKGKNKKHLEEFAKVVDALVIADEEARFQSKIFDKLHFKEQDDRIYSISKPDEGSFQWIWQPQQTGITSFPDWLGDTSGQNVFWLTGA